MEVIITRTCSSKFRAILNTISYVILPEKREYLLISINCELILEKLLSTLIRCNREPN